MTERWDRHFLNLATEHAKMSKDPSSKCGALIVGPDLGIRSFGFNGFPRGVADTIERLNDRETKLKLVVHAEENSIIHAAKTGVSIDGCTLYVVSVTGGKLSSIPCIRCAVKIIQSGIKEIVGYASDFDPNWKDSLTFQVFEEAGVVYRTIPQVCSETEVSSFIKMN